MHKNLVTHKPKLKVLKHVLHCMLNRPKMNMVDEIIS